MIQSKWKGRNNYAKQHEVEQASRLAFRGHLTEVGNMNLGSLNLTNIPGDLMAELTKCVKKEIYIFDNSRLGHHNLSAILRNARCRRLAFWNVSLNSSDTQLLVQALSSVEELKLWWGTKVDIKTLTSYSGNGSCRYIKLENIYIEALDGEYRRKLTKFAEDKGWKVTYNDSNLFVIERF